MSDDIEDEEFFAEQTNILQELSSALIEATPEWWEEATLRIEVSDEGTGHTITSTAYPHDIVIATDEIFEQTSRLQDLFERSPRMWKSVVFCVKRNDHDDEEAWDYTADYLY